MGFSREIDHSLYPQPAIEAATRSYELYCTVSEESLGGTRSLLTIAVSENYTSDACEVVLGFLNYALDLALQTHLGEE